MDADELGPVAELLRAADALVRGAAVECFRALGPAGGAFAPELTARLTDPDALVRLSAVAALGRQGPAGADALTALLADEDLRPRATSALAAMGEVRPASGLRLAALPRGNWACYPLLKASHSNGSTSTGCGVLFYAQRRSRKILVWER